MFLVPAILAVLLFGIDVCIRADPLDSTTELLRGVDRQFRQSITIDKTPYALKPFPEDEQGSHSETYEVVDNYEDTSAVLKLAGKNNGIDVVKEGEYLEEVGLLLKALEDPEDDNNYALIMRNVRVGYPHHDSPPLKPFHEWYLLDESMDEETLPKLQTLVNQMLQTFYDDYGLIYPDFHLQNIFVTQTLDFAMAVDWAPPKQATANQKSKVGVMRVAEIGPAQVKNYWKFVKRTLRSDFGLLALSTVLQSKGKILRDADQERAKQLWKERQEKLKQVAKDE